MTTPDDVHTLSGAYALDALDLEEAAEFRAHLDGCAACRQEVHELRRAAARMGAVETVAPPPGLRARVLAAADRTPQLPPPARAEESASAPLRRSAGGAPERGRRWNRLAMAAAALVVVGGGAVAVSQVLDDPPETAATPAERVFEAADARTLGEPTENGGTLLVAVSPSRDEMAVDTSDLPRLGEDRVYQIWTLEGEVVQSAGVIEEPGGAEAMELPDEGVTVALTIEPAGGSELPTSTPIVQVEPATV